MNAYELADQVEMWGKDLLALNMKGGIPVTEGAKLIRQQADRIAELEKAYSTIFKEYKEYYEQQTTASYTINVKGGSITIGENHDKKRQETTKRND
jgi:hypothetical protein